MSRKIISLFTLLAFIVFSVTCYTMKFKEVKTAADWQGKKVKILAVEKTSGEYIEFSKKRPGRISEDSITGIIEGVRKKIEIDFADTKEIIRDEKGKILEVTDKDGKKYEVIIGSTREEEDKIIFAAELYESVSIPLTEVKSIQVKRFNPFKAIINSVSIAGLIFVTSLLILPLVFAERD